MQARILLVWSLALVALSGCELVADFDRSEIPGNRVDSGVRPLPPEEEEEDAGPSDDEDAG
jgi:hypothetical protein